MSKKIQLKLNITLIYLIFIYISPISSSRVYPIHKFIITNDLNHSNISNINLKEYFHFSLDVKGVGIIFEKSSNVSLIPYHLFKQIKKILDVYSSDSNSYILDKENDYKEIIIFYFLNNNFSFNLILEKIGITFPNDVLFYRPKDEINKNYFIFLTKENQENIIFGKNLIDLMKIEFDNDEDFIINNNDFVTHLEEL